jgi:small subunit ribosomal protein S10
MPLVPRPIDGYLRHNRRINSFLSSESLSIQSRSCPRRMMPHYARIKLTSANLEQLERVAKSIREIADKTGVRVKGPQPLPTKRLKVTTRKAPTGEGSHTFDHWQLRIHRRILDVQPDDRTLRQITKLDIPEDVRIEIILTT